MDFAFSLSQALPVVKRYQVDATVSNTGVPLMIDTSAQGGLNAGTTTSAADFVGMAQDTVTYTTSQGTGSDSAERKVGVIINPDAVWSAIISGAATENTNIPLITETTGSSGGTAVTDSANADWTSAEYKDGVVWGYSGANAGQVRKITTTSSTAGTVVIPFDSEISVGDVFLRAGWWFNMSNNVQLTTNLYQVNSLIAVGTGAEFKVVDMELRDAGGEGRAKSKIFMIADDHIYAGRP